MKTNHLFLLIIWLAVLYLIYPTSFNQPLYGASYYVSTMGNDTSGNGTPGNPYRTIQYTLDNVVSAGDTVIIRGGTYNEALRIRPARVTLCSYPNERAIIQNPFDNAAISETIRLDVDSDGCRLQRLEIIGGYYYVIKLETRWDYGDPQDRTGTSNILIEDCIIHDSGRDCVKITPGCDDVTLRRCEIYHSGQRDNSNAEGIDNVNGDRTLVQDCTIHDIATTGVYFKGGATGCIVERTRIENAGALGVSLGFDTSPEYFDLTVNPNRYENINGTVRNCLIIGSGYAGIGIYAAQNPKVFNNTVINSAQAGQTPLLFGVVFQDYETAGPGGYRPPSVNADIKNNIFAQLDTGPATIVQLRYSDELGGIYSLTGAPNMDYNTYYASGAPVVFDDRRPGHIFNGNLTQWKSHIANDALSREENPGLNSLYTLEASSPCKDSGLDLGSYFIVDFNRGRRPGGTAWDRGAFEYGTHPILVIPDFNNDYKTDLILRYYASPGGWNMAWNMNGITKIESFNLPRINDIDWEIEAVGDFNRDGHADIAWRYYNSSSPGWNMIWFMDGPNRTQSLYLPRLSDLNWHIETAGDLNNDGNADLLWRYYGTNGGWNMVWFLDGINVIDTQYFQAVPDIQWKIEGTGDFNNDNHTDILWRYYGTNGGWNMIWLMNGTNKISTVNLPRVPDIQWEIDGTGDFNNDDRPDILWRYYGSNGGWNMVWYMNGTTHTQSVLLPRIANLDWKFEN